MCLGQASLSEDRKQERDAWMLAGIHKSTIILAVARLLIKVQSHVDEQTVNTIKHGRILFPSEGSSM